MRALPVLLMILLLVFPAHAQEEPDAFQPDTSKIVTNDPGALDPGQLEIQPGWQMITANRFFDNAGARHAREGYIQQYWSVQVTCGVAENIDVNLTLGWSDTLDRSNAFDPDEPQLGPFRGVGVADTQMGARWEFHEDDDSSKAHLAFLTIPTGVYGTQDVLGFTQGYTSLSYQYSTANAWDRFIVNTDLGVNVALSPGPGDPKAGLIGNVAAGWQFVDWFQPVVELNYQNLWSESAPYNELLQVTVGAMLYPADTVRLNLGYSWPVHGRNALEQKAWTFFVTWDL